MLTPSNPNPTKGRCLAGSLTPAQGTSGNVFRASAYSSTKGFYELLLLNIISGADERTLWVEAPAMKA